MLRYFKHFGGSITFLVLITSLFSVRAFAVDSMAEDKTAPRYDVRIIIDISGSMKETDPNNLRIPALNLLLELMPEGAQAGIWTFGHYVNNLVPVAQVDDDWRLRAKNAAASISSLGLHTNLVGALDDAAWGLKEDSGYQQSIILLTDGKLDMPKEFDAAQERQRLMRQVLEKYRKTGANIHTLALSDLADKALLQEIALETDGLYSQAQDADALMKAFLRAFDQAVPAEQVPMEDNTFVIDSSVDEFTALIFKRSGGPQETALLTPQGQRLTQLDHPRNVRWHKDVSFDLVTIKQPEAGTWIAEADLDPANRVTILSDLALSVEGLPSTLFPGDKLDVEIKLTNEGDVVKRVEILSLTDVTMKVVTASGREGRKILSDPENPPVDGIYREGLFRLKELGQYQVDIIAEGRTFQRKRSFSMTMVQPIEIEQEADAVKGVYRIKVKSLSDNLDIERTRVIAKISSPDDSTIIQSVLYDKEAQAWVGEIGPNKGVGQYRVDLNVRGITQGGKNFKVKPESIVFQLPIAMDTLDDGPAVAEGITSKVAPGPVVTAVDLDAKQADAGEDLAESGQSLKAESLETESLEEEEGLAWWIYLILVLINVLVIGLGVWWFVLRKPAASDVQTSLEKDGPLADLETFEEDLAGDFDSLDEGDEIEIPLAPDVSPEDAVDSGSDTLPDAEEVFDEEFSIDPDEEVDTDEDSWGEFDKEKKD